MKRSTIFWNLLIGILKVWFILIPIYDSIFKDTIINYFNDLKTIYLYPSKVYLDLIAFLIIVSLIEIVILLVIELITNKFYLANNILNLKFKHFKRFFFVYFNPAFFILLFSYNIILYIINIIPKLIKNFNNFLDKK